MSNSIEEVSEKKAVQNEQMSSEAAQYVKTVERLLRTTANCYLFSQTKGESSKEDELPISNTHLAKSFLVAGKAGEADFTPQIHEELSASIEPTFLAGFTEIIKRELNVLRKIEGDPE